jgi:hypothetical protein
MVAGSLETVKLVSDVVSNVVTIAAVAIGGVWTYLTFIRERTRWPKANLELVMSHRELTPERTLLHVKVKVHNAGRGLMKLDELQVHVRHVFPLSEETSRELEDGALIDEHSGKARWRSRKQDRHACLWGPGQPEPRSVEPEVEPGENDEYPNDFIVPSSLKTVFVYVYLKNVARRGREQLGWTVTSYYDLAGTEGGDSTKNVIAREAA